MGEVCTLLLLLLSHFSHVQLWGGLQFPSPMHEREKWKWSRSVSVWLFVTPWTVAYQAPPSMGFSRQEYWSGLPLPSPVCTLDQTKLPKMDQHGWDNSEDSKNRKQDSCSLWGMCRIRKKLSHFTLHFIETTNAFCVDIMLLINRMQKYTLKYRIISKI